MDNRQMISQIFEYLHPDKNGDEEIDDRAFDIVDLFVINNLNGDLAELVYNLTIDSKEIQKICCLFDILIWSTADNGTALLETTKKWFLGDNQRKIELALFITNVYPLYPFDKLRERLIEIKISFPYLVARCNYWLDHIPNH